MDIQRTKTGFEIRESYFSYPRVCLIFYVMISIITGFSFYFGAHIISKPTFILFLIIISLGVLSLFSKNYSYVDLDENIFTQRVYILFGMYKHTVRRKFKKIFFRKKGEYSKENILATLETENGEIIKYRLFAIGVLAFPDTINLLGDIKDAR